MISVSGKDRTTVAGQNQAKKNNILVNSNVTFHEIHA